MRALEMPRLQWARIRLPAADGRGETMGDWYDVFPLDDIRRPAFIQRDPTTRHLLPKNQRFFVNPFVC